MSESALSSGDTAWLLTSAGLLWFGWFGFNAGSALAANQTAAIVFVNTLMAGCTGLLAWLLVERVRDGHATSFGAASGGGPDQLLKQSVAALATFAFSGTVTALLVLVLDRTIGFRVAEEHELSGVDLVLHAETAYDLHASTGGARPHIGGSSGTLLH